MLVPQVKEVSSLTQRNGELNGLEDQEMNDRKEVTRQVNGERND